MKLLFQGLLLIMFSVAEAQDTTFFNKNSEEVATLSNADYYSFKKYSTKDSNQLESVQYFINGNQKMSISYKDYSRKIVDGNKKEWYRNGQLKSSVDYVENEIDGQILTYWEDGSKKRIDNYKKDKFISGACFDQNGEELEHFRFFIMPRYKSCLEKKKKQDPEKVEQCTTTEIFKHIVQTTRYPKMPRDKGVAGTVYVQFHIDTTGKVSNPTLLRGVAHGEKLNEEALRVVSSLPDMLPGEQDGQKVRVQYNVPIKFQLR